MANITLLPSTKVPLVYDGDNTMTTEWYRFFWNIYGFTGDPSGAIPVNKGGTGLTTIGTHELIIGNANNVFEPTTLVGSGITITYGTGTVTLAIGNSGVTPGTYGNASTVGQFVVDIHGTLTFAQNVPIAIAASQITSGQLPVIYGGTGASTASGARANLSAAVLGANNDITSLSAITGGISTPQFIQMDDGNSQTLAAGKLWYTPNTGAWNLGMGGGNITQQVGEELFVYGKASAAITDSPLQIIYQTGAVGASGTIKFAPTVAGITDGNLILGVATESLGLNAFGRITSWGIVHGITTNGTAFGEVWADGDTIWYNPVTGNPTNVKPVAPNIKVSVGTIIKAGAGGSGSIQVEVNHGSVLGGTDSNVQITSPANANILTYDGTDLYWKNTILTAGTGVTISNSATGVITINATGTGGTVTSVAALTIGTTGTDLSSTVANSTTTPVITLNVPTASATNRGALSSTDWTTFNNKAPGVTFTTGYIPYGQGNTTLNQSSGLQFDGTNFTTTGSATAASFIPSSSTIPTNGMYLVTTNTLGWSTNSAIKLRLDATGNFGIGMTPGAKLDVTSSAAFAARITGPANVYQDITDGTGTLRLQVLSNSPYLASIGAYPFILATNNTERLRIFSSGGVSIDNTTDPGATNLSVTGTGKFGTTVGVGAATPAASGAGITFPATQSASTDVNTLDDYEEGTWSPVISDGTNNATMDSNTSGTYTKIGNAVTISAYIITSSLGSVSGAIRITGLPFTVSNANNGMFSGTTAGWANQLAITAGQSVGMYTNRNTTYMPLYVWTATAGVTAMTGTQWTNTGAIIINVTYKTT